jgi:hypothetical protein
MRELSVSFASSEKKSKGKKEAGPKAASRNQPSIPLPFTGVVREDCCIGVKQNHGLYTQCFSAPGENDLCKGCAKQASKNASGEPDCGVISKRVMQGTEYRDAKGRGPVHYTKVMKKQKLTEEQVQTEAAKFGIEIDASHFAVPEAQQKRGRPKKATTSDTESETSSSAADAAGTSNEKKTRGRPKKAAKVVEVNETEDLFASLMQQAQSASPRPSKEQAQEVQEDDASSISASDSESDSESKGSKKKTKKTKEESEEELADKAAKFLAKEEAKEKKAAAKAAEKEQAQQEKAKKAAEKEQAQQEKALKLAEKEAEKLKKAAEKEKAQQGKALKLAEKEAKKAEEKPKKAEKSEKSEKSEKKTKKPKKAEEPAKPVEPVADLESEDEESDTEEPVVTVKKFEHQGVTYLKSSDGILYDAKSQEVVGKWNEKAGMIDVYNGDSEEEESDEDDE